MKNLGLAGAIALCGIGLILIGLGNFRTQTVYAAPAVAVHDKGEPTIVWYGIQSGHEPRSSTTETSFQFIYRAWSDGTVECKAIRIGLGGECDPFEYSNCDDDLNDWRVLSSPTDGLSATADITFDEVVDGQDLAVLLAAWGEAPRNPMPPTACFLSDLNS